MPNRLARSRTRALAERRLSLVRLLVALFVLRVVVTIGEIAESRLTLWSVLITAAIGLEAWRGWTVARVAGRAHAEPAPLSDTTWDRLLRPAERWGPYVLYGLAAVYVVASLALLVAGASHETLLDVSLIVRELTTLLFVAVVVAGYLSVRGAEQPAADG